MSGWWLASYVALWLLLLATVFVLLVVLRQLGLIYMRVRGGAGMQLEDGPQLNSVLRFNELDLDEQPVNFPINRSMFNLVLCTTPECRICEDALRGLAAVLDHYDLRAVVVDAGEAAAAARLRHLADDGVHIVSSLALQRKLGVTAIPYAIVTDGKGVVYSKGTVHHLDDLEDVLDRAGAAVEPVAT